MNKNMKTTAQGGFTLIELIVVIVILGILAATALPKFADMGGDARKAAVQGARGNLDSVVAMTHGKSLINPGSPVQLEGLTVAMKNGYPDVATDKGVALQGIAGLNDWTRIDPGTAATDNSPATGADQVAFIPKSAASTTKGLKCYVMYKEAPAAPTTGAAIVTADFTDC